MNDTEGTNCNIECSGGRHMFISSGSTVTIDGFNFKNAETTSVALASGSSFIGTNIVFDNNEATKYAWTITGGAIGARTNTYIELTNCNFYNNKSCRDGGAIYQESGGTLKIVGGNFEYNEATDGSGGAIYTESDIEVCRLEDKINVQHNVASQHGGGIALLGDSDASDCDDDEIAHIYFNMNVAINGYGGGVYLLDGNDSLHCSMGDNTAWLHQDAGSFCTWDEDTEQCKHQYSFPVAIDTMSTFQAKIDSIPYDSFDDGDSIPQVYVRPRLFTDEDGKCDFSSDIYGYALEIPDNTKLEIVCYDENNGILTDADSCSIECSGGRHVIVGNDSYLKVSGFTFKNANYGSIVLKSGSTLEGSYLKFEDNIETDQHVSGGAIGAHDDTTVILSNTEFNNNESREGGAIYQKTGGILTISDSIFSNNVATSGSGGAMYTNSHLTLCDDLDENSDINDGVLFLNNIAYENGGAIAIMDNDGYIETCASNFYDLNVNNNIAMTGYGGGLFVYKPMLSYTDPRDDWDETKVAYAAFNNEAPSNPTTDTSCLYYNGSQTCGELDYAIIINI